MVGRRYVAHGRVQGVSFRWQTRDAAAQIGVGGWVRNRRDGSVEAEAWGGPAQLSEFEEALRHGPALARVDRLDTDELADEGTPRADFEILPTE